MTLGQWLDTWFELYIQPSGLALNTKKMYNRAIRAIPPRLSSRDIEDLTVFDIRRWILDVSVDHPRAAQLDRVMMLRALTMAHKAGMAPQSLCDPDLLPEIAHKARRAPVLDPVQLQAYYRAACADPDAIALAFMACGLRRSEALGVRWDAIDLAAGTLAVVGQRLPGSDELSPCKTPASVRVLALPASLCSALRRIPRPIDGGWVCTVSHRQIYRVHEALLQRLSLPAVTLHGLRHSYATAAVIDGVPIKVLQGALGHASYQITANLYADHLPTVSQVSCRVYS